MIFSHSLGIAAFLIIMSNNRAIYVNMASPPSFTISPLTLSGPTDFFSFIAANFSLMILVPIAKDSPELARCVCGMLL
jgi:hypothetical protein